MEKDPEPTLPATQTPEPGFRDVDLWERTQPRSVINLVPPAVQAHLLEASISRPELFLMNERDLWNYFKSEMMLPSATDNQIRLKFWLEYDSAQANMKFMEMSSVYAGICSRQYFYGTFLARAEKVAWMLQPPVDYVTKLEEGLDFGLSQLRDILEHSHVMSNGRVDSRLGELKAKIVAMFDLRLKGAVTQKVEHKNMNLNISTSDRAVAQRALGMTMEELERKEKELQRRERRALNLPIEDEPKEGEVIIEAEGTTIPSD